MALEFVFILLLVAAVLLIVGTPIVRRERAGAADARLNQIAELEAAKEIKLSEIRDAELDLRAGKLTKDSFTRLDRELRRQAIEIIRQLDGLRSEDRGSEG